MTSLGKILIRRIAATGPMTLADYMSECLLHPEFGYYSTRDPFGSVGDFTTAPEISQMFGELIGLCLAQNWVDQGCPDPFTLAELGPGRGTLMADILRATRSIPGFHNAAQVHLVEASQSLRDIQRATLSQTQIVWVGDVSHLPDAPLFVVANEFFDALPIRQFTRDPAGWRETQVGVQGGSLSLGLSAATPIAILESRLHDTQPGSVVEVCPQAGPIMQVVSETIEKRGGCALVIDYGDWRSLGDTWQAIKDHKPVEPVDQPGESDLTAHVDFEALSLAAGNLKATRMTPQGVFLERLGITPRAQTLAKNLAGTDLDSHISAHRRLTHPDEMGSLFKVIAFHPNGTPPPPGLTP